MTFGCADMMDVPWETIIKMYARKLGSGTFSAALEEYAASSLSFIQDVQRAFSPPEQAECVKHTVGPPWCGYRSELRRIGESCSMTSAGKREALIEIIREDQAQFKKYRRLNGLAAKLRAL